jgi:hypothetical protein
MLPKAMKRFSLRVLFTASTLLILFLGYSQWRRQDILRQVKEVEQLGGQVTLSNELSDYIWQRRPEGRVFTKSFNIKEYSEIEQQTRRNVGVKYRMKQIGITKIMDVQVH